MHIMDTLCLYRPALIYVWAPPDNDGDGAYLLASLKDSATEATASTSAKIRAPCSCTSSTPSP